MLILKNLFKLTLILAFVAGCRGTEKKEDGSTDGSSGDAKKDTEAERAADAAAGFNVSVQPDKKYTYKIHRGTGAVTDDWDAPCRIDVAATGVDRNITCVVEANELDLFFFGVGIRFNVPPSMCNYVLQSPPYFYRHLPGTGASSVIDNRAGSVVNGGVAAGTIFPYLTCPFDYSGSGGPNCCEGNYSLAVYTDDPAQPADKLVVTNAKWNGKAANCLSGPAMTVAKKFTETGYPLNTLYYIEGVGINIGYFMEAPITSGKLSNVSVANYYFPAEHVGGTPLMTKPPGGFQQTQRDHEFMCLDRNREVLASIRVQIREWNTADQFAIGAAGNPDVTGAETSGVGSFNDYGDVKDVGEGYPGFGL